MRDIGDDEVDSVALLCSSAIPHAYPLVYISGSAQELTPDRGDRWQLQFPHCLQAKTICYGLGNKVVSGAWVNEHRVGVVTLATEAFR